MTNADVRRIALAQSAIDCGCAPEDFLKTENVIAAANADPRARAYLPRPVECDLVSYGSNVVAQVSGRVRDAVTGYVNAYPAQRAFETPHLYALNDALAPFGLKTCYIAEYFLPDVDGVRVMAMYHPSALLRDESKKPETFDDLKALEREIQRICQHTPVGWRTLIGSERRPAK